MVQDGLNFKKMISKWALCLYLGASLSVSTGAFAAPTVTADSVHLPITVAEMAQPIPTDPDLLKGQLANGLRYYILQHTQPVHNVELRLVVRTGSANETEPERGISHFIEHMVFNGTRLYPGHRVIDTLENMGVQFGTDLNASTGFDETVFTLPIPLNNPKNFDTALELLEEMAFNATFAPAQVNQERAVIMEEWRASTLSAAARQQAANLAVTAKGSIYAQRLPIGLTSVIQGATPELLRSYYKRWYRPDLMAVVVVGDIDPRRAEAMVAQHFAGYKNPPAPVVFPNKKLPNNTEPLVGTFNDTALSQSTVVLINKDHSDYVEQKTIGEYIDTQRMGLVTQMINQRLQAQLDGASGKTPPFIQAGVEVDYVSGIVRTKQGVHWYAVANPGQERAALEALRDTALQVLDHGFTQAELDRAVRNQMTFLNVDSNNYQKAAEYVRGVVENEPLPPLSWERAAQRSFVPRITLAEVNQIARRFIQENNRVAIVNSNSVKPNLTTEQMISILAQHPTVAAYSEGTTRDSLMTTLPKSGKVAATAYDRNIDVTTWTLSNGVTVSFKPVPNNDGPIIFSAYAPGGFSRLSDADWKKTQWGFDGLVEAGVNGLSKTQVARVLAGKDFSMQLTANSVSQGLSGKFNVHDSESAFQMMYSLMTGINRNAEAFQAYINRNMAATAKLKDDRDAAFEESIQSALQRHSKRYNGTLPTATDWSATDYDTTYRAYRDLFSNANGMHFVLVGNGELNQIKQLSAQYLGALPSDSAHRLSARDNGDRLDYTTRTVQLNKGTEALAQVRISLGGEMPYSEHDKLVLDALAHVLNLRLIDRLRVQDGGVYSPYVYADMGKLPYPQFAFVAGFACAPENVKLLIADTEDEIKQLVNNGVRAQDLLKFQQAERATFAKRINTNEFWVANIQQAQMNGEPSSSITDYPTEVLKLTADDVHAAAKKFLSGSRVTAILQPENR